MNWIDTFGYCAAFLTTISFLPQVILTWRTRDTTSLSLGMYSAFTTGVLMWLIYGIQKGDHIITVANLITLILAGSILALKLYHVFWQKQP